MHSNKNNNVRITMQDDAQTAAIRITAQDNTHTTAIRTMHFSVPLLHLQHTDHHYMKTKDK